MKGNRMDCSDAVPNGWRRVRLGEIAEIAFSGVDKKILPGEMPIRLCNYTDVFYNRRITPGLEFTDGTASEAECDRWSLKKGHVLFTKDSETPDEIGVASVVTEDIPDVLCGYHLGVASPARGTVEGSFLAAALNSAPCRKQFSKAANGVTRFGLTLDSTRSISVHLPPVLEQRAISSVLDSVQDTIQHTAAVIAAKETLRDALLQELLTRGVPGWHSEWQNVPGIGQIPAEWEVVRLEDVAQVNPKRPSLDVPPERPVTFLPMAAVDENAAGIVTRELRAFRDVAKGYTYFEENDVLFAKITPCLQNGKHTLATGLVGQFGFGTTEFHVVRAGDKIEPGHLFRVLTRPANIEKCVRSFSGTAGQQRVHPEILKALHVSLPPLPEQKVISTTLDSVDQRIAWARNELQELESAKEALADALLTGRVRIVPDEPSTGSRIHARQ